MNVQVDQQGFRLSISYCRPKFDELGFMEKLKQVPGLRVIGIRHHAADGIEEYSE
jgi:hypothetical protein